MLWCHSSPEWFPNSPLWDIWGNQRLEITAIMDDVLWIQSRMPNSLTAEEWGLRGIFILRNYLKRCLKNNYNLFCLEPFWYLLVYLSSLKWCLIEIFRAHFKIFPATKIHHQLSVPWNRRARAFFFYSHFAPIWASEKKIQFIPLVVASIDHTTMQSKRHNCDLSISWYTMSKFQQISYLP